MGGQDLCGSIRGSMDEESSSQGKPATTAGVPLLPGEADNGPGLGSSSVVLDSGRGQGEAGELQGHYEAGEGENFKGATPSNFSGHAAAFEVGNGEHIPIHIPTILTSSSPSSPLSPPLSQ